MSKKVNLVYFYETFMIPGVGQIDRVLPGNKKIEGLDMDLQDNGSLLVHWTSGKAKNSLTVGAASIKIAVHPAETLENIKR